MRRVFINMTNHEMSDEQVAEAQRMADVVISLKEEYPEMATSLLNTPDNLTDIYCLVSDLLEVIQAISEQYDEVYLHLPVGSPAFMFALSQRIVILRKVTPLFSHSQRVSVDEPQPDGSVVKRSVFKFEKFIIFSY